MIISERGRPIEAAASRSVSGTERQHVLGGAHHHRDDDHRERHRAGPAGEMAHRRDHDLVDEQADDDRRRAQQDVVDEAHHRGQLVVAAVFGHVGAGQDADRRADQHRRARSSPGCP